MMLIRSTIKFSPIHGLGCYADEDISAGQLVWKFDPALDLVYKEADLSSFPEPFQEFLKVYAYGQEAGSEKTFILCGDHARHMNHSETPNLTEIESDVGVNVALRDIKAGEELTVDYTLFDADFSKKLGPL